MKKTLCLLFALITLLISCSKKECSHIWIDATCQSPRTCSLCGITTGDVSSEHKYINHKCSVCGLIETIQLTLDNYEDYIECHASVKAKSTRELITSKKYMDVYSKAECSFEAIGNSHYKYNDVTITIKFCHYNMEEYSYHTLYEIHNLNSLLEGTTVEDPPKDGTPADSSTLTVKLNLAGNGSTSCTLYTPWRETMIKSNEYFDTYSILNCTTFEVLSISGTVQEY